MSEGCGIDLFAESPRILKSGKTEHLVREKVTFVDRQVLHYGDNQVKAKNIIIAVGVEATNTQEWGKFRSHIFTTDEFFELEDLPKSVAVVGLESLVWRSAKH